MSVFLERIEVLRASKDSVELKAAALLETRGINQRLNDEARRELKIIQEVEFPPMVTEDLPAVDAVADELWTWYQQWAEIARVAISNRRTRITLGISSTRTSASEDGAPSN